MPFLRFFRWAHDCKEAMHVVRFNGWLKFCSVDNEVENFTLKKDVREIEILEEIFLLVVFIKQDLDEVSEFSSET